VLFHPGRDKPLGICGSVTKKRIMHRISTVSRGNERITVAAALEVKTGGTLGD
jgi:hypothetical protein